MRRSRLCLGRVFLTVLFAVGIYSVLVSSASSAVRYDYLGPYGSTSEISSPQRMVVHQASGLLYVADRAGNRVRIYESSEDHLLEHVADLTSADRADPGDNLIEPSTLAIDQQTGDLYVAKTGAPSELIRFLPADPADPRDFVEDATFTSPAGVVWAQAGTNINRSNVRGGLAVVHDAADQPLILVADPGVDQVRAFGPTGAPALIFPGLFVNSASTNCSSCSGGLFSDLVDLASGPDGGVYAIDATGPVRLIRLAPTGTIYSFDREWEAEIENDSPRSPRVTVDQVKNEIFVADRTRFVQLASPGDDDFVFVSDQVPSPEGGQFYERGGLAVLGTDDPAADGRLYLSASEYPVFGASPTAAAVQVYGSAGLLVDPPQATLGALSDEDVEADAVHLRGSVTPFEAGAVWRFEHRLCDREGCQPWPNHDAGEPAWQGPLVGDDYSQPIPVQFSLSGLTPNSKYEVRLRARNSRASVLSDAVTEVNTKRAAPLVSVLPAASVSAWRATLAAEVDPRNAAAEYQFELLDADGTARKLPASPAQLSASAGSTVVTAEALSLEPETDYSFTLRANSAEEPSLATGAGPVQFTTLPARASELPERGFELISPANAKARITVPVMLSPDGERAWFRSWIPLPDSKNGGFDHRVSQRAADGSWTVSPHSAVGPAVYWGNLGYAVPILNSRLTASLYVGNGDHDPNDKNEAQDAYLRDLDDDDVTWLSRDQVLPSESGPDVTQELFVSDDGKQALFTSRRRLLSTDMSVNPTLYEWKDGVLRQVAFRPGATAGPSEGSTLGSGQGDSAGTYGELHNAVSRDGGRIAFSLTAGGGGTPTGLYIRESGERTIEVATGGAVYWGADRDMETVFYVLNGDLYAFDVESKQSVLVHPPVVGGAGVYRALHISDDGRRVYFVSTKDVLNTGVETEPYALWVADRATDSSAFEVRYISSVDPGYNSVWNRSVSSRHYGADPEGEVLAFLSRTDVVPGRNGGGYPQVYVYRHSDNALYCASCPSDGSPASNPGALQPVSVPGIVESARTTGYSPATAPPRVVAEDGTVIFATPLHLGAGDLDSNMDIYEWRGGEVSLVSSGLTGSPDILGGISSDGKTVLFGSKADLVQGLDEQSVFRVYVARVGSSTTSHDVSEANCRGQACRKVEGSPPPLTRQSNVERDQAKSRIQGCQNLGHDARRATRKLRGLRQRLNMLRKKTSRLPEVRSKTVRRKVVSRIKRQQRAATRQKTRLANCRRGK